MQAHPDYKPLDIKRALIGNAATGTRTFSASGEEISQYRELGVCNVDNVTLLVSRDSGEVMPCWEGCGLNGVKERRDVTRVLLKLSK